MMLIGISLPLLVIYVWIIPYKIWTENARIDACNIYLTLLILQYNLSLSLRRKIKCRY